MPKKIYTKVKHPELSVVNNTTGEIISGVADIRCETIDEFIMCFMSCIPQVVRLDGNTIRVLMWCWKFSTFNPNIPEANVVTNDQAFKDRIRQEGGDMTNSTIDKAIYILHKEGMLIRRCKGSYFLNPDYFFKGTLSNRAKLKCSISFGNED